MSFHFSIAVIHPPPPPGSDEKMLGNEKGDDRECRKEGQPGPRQRRLRCGGGVGGICFVGAFMFMVMLC